MNQMPAIVAVGYNRKDSLERLLNSILAADYPDGEIPLIISIDHHPDNQPVIDLANSILWEHGPKIVKIHDQRMGLRPHVLECGGYSQTYGCAILLEDDLFVSKSSVPERKMATMYFCFFQMAYLIFSWLCGICSWQSTSGRTAIFARPRRCSIWQRMR